MPTSCRYNNGIIHIYIYTCCVIVSNLVSWGLFNNSIFTRVVGGAVIFSIMIVWFDVFQVLKRGVVIEHT